MISSRVQPAKLIRMLAQYMNVVLNKETKSFEKIPKRNTRNKKCCKPNIKYHGYPSQQHHSGGGKY